GGVLYYLLTLRPPCAGATPLECLELIEAGEVPPPSTLEPGVDRDLELICLKCLRKSPQERYALADDLEGWLAGRPTQARDYSAGERLARWCRRHWVAATVAALALVTALSLPAALYGLWRAEQARADAAGARLEVEAQK